MSSMTKYDILKILNKLDMHPSRKLGQNFLIDPNLLQAMVQDANPQADEQILEIGPGTGVLTRELLAAKAKVTSVELDHRLAGFLRDDLANFANFTIIEGDACRQDYDEIFTDQPYRCIANLPYACSSVLIAKLLATKNSPQEMYILLQKEMADRLAAVPGTKNYGALSVQVQLKYKVKTMRKVPKEVFLPPPDVGSSFVQLADNGWDIPCEVRKTISEVANFADGSDSLMDTPLDFAKRDFSLRRVSVD